MLHSPAVKKQAFFFLKWIFSEQDRALALSRACMTYNSSYRRASASEHHLAIAPTHLISPHSMVSPLADERCQQEDVPPVSCQPGKDRVSTTSPMCTSNLSSTLQLPWFSEMSCIQQLQHQLCLPSGEKSIATRSCSPEVAPWGGLTGPRGRSPESILPGPSKGLHGLTCQEQT